MKDLKDEDKRLEPNPGTPKRVECSKRRRAFNVRKMEALKGSRISQTRHRNGVINLEYEKVKGEEKQADREAEAERERQMQKQSAEYLRLERKMQERWRKKPGKGTAAN